MKTAVRFTSDCAMSEVAPALLAELLREALREGKSPYLTVVSNSMSPLIKRSDQIQLAPIRAEQLQPGDIIVYEGPANLISHRYWATLKEMEQIQLVTRGDRPQHFDEPFASVNLIGRVIGRRRKHQFLNLTQGTGKWLNAHLSTLAKLEIRLFANSLELPNTNNTNTPSINGQFFTSTNNFFVRMIRRLIYSWAIILTLMISYLSSELQKDLED